MLAFVGILAGEAVEFSSPLFGDKIVGPDVYQFQEADQLDKFAELQTKELNNGLLAMIGVTSAIVQELVNDKGIFENLGLEGSLSAAFDTGILLRVLEVLFLNSKCQLAK